MCRGLVNRFFSTQMVKGNFSELSESPSLRVVCCFFLQSILSSFSLAIYSGPTKSISFPSGVTNASSWRGPSLSSLFSVGNDDQHSIDGANSAWLYFIRLFVYRKCSNPVNYLKQQLLMTLQEVLLDDGRPFCSHYGAVVGLTELGPEVKSDCLHSQFCIFSCDCREWSPNSRGPVHFSCGERRKSEERAN